MLQLEQSGSVIMQTVIGLLLDWHKTGDQKDQQSALQIVLNVFLVLNVIQFFTILGLAYLQRKKDLAVDAVLKVGTPDSNPVSTSEEEPLLDAPQPRQRYASTSSQIRSTVRDELKTKQEIRRGFFFASCSLFLIIFTWVLFMGTAYFRLGNKKHH